MNDAQRLKDLEAERDILRKTLKTMEEIKALRDKLVQVWPQAVLPQPTVIPLPYPVPQPYPVYPYPRHPYQPVWYDTRITYTSSNLGEVAHTSVDLPGSSTYACQLSS